MSTFGSRLRTVRVERGLSQGEVGNGTYSASYISHLESGRRRATSDVIAFLAERLGVTAEELEATSEPDSDASRDANRAASELRMLAAVAAHDHAAVIAAADSPYVPSAAEDSDSWWGTKWLKAEAQLATEDHDGCLETVKELLASPLVAVSPELRSAALALGSRASRASGRLVDSLSSATDAVSSAFLSESATRKAIALREQIAAFAELGRNSEAASAAEELSAIRADLVETQVIGLAAWTLGNVAFLAGDVEAGIREHALAAEALRPESDLRLWARFHKASAAMRMAAGSEIEVEHCLDLAGQGLALVGNASDNAELELLRAARKVNSDPAAALDHIARAFSLATLPNHAVAEGEIHRSRAFENLGDTENARAALVSAATHFDAAGADRRSADVWRRLAGEQASRAE